MELSKILRIERMEAWLTELPENFYQQCKNDIDLKISQGADTEEVLHDRTVLRSLKALRIKKAIRASMKDAFSIEATHTKDYFQPVEREFYEAIIEKVRAI